MRARAREVRVPRRERAIRSVRGDPRQHVLKQFPPAGYPSLGREVVSLTVSRAPTASRPGARCRVSDRAVSPLGRLRPPGRRSRGRRGGGADLVHVDVMDGHFVPNLTIGPPVVKALKRATRLPLDVHLMIESPESYDREYLARARTGSPSTSRRRGTSSAASTRSAGGARRRERPSIPARPSRSLAAAWGDLDYAVVMSVNPGWGGQPFLPDSVGKVRRAPARFPWHGAAAPRSRWMGE